MNKIIGITGTLGSGKSTFAHYLKQSNPSLHILELDDIRRYALWHSQEPHHILLRQKLASAFNLKHVNPYYMLDRKHTTECIFQDTHSLSLYSAIATPILQQDISHYIQQHKGTFVIVWAYLLEEHYDAFINGSVFIVDCELSLINERLLQQNDNLSKQDILKRKSIEPTYENKVQLALQRNIEFIEVKNTIHGFQSQQDIFSRIRV